jgi:hypothetical protein
MLGFEQKNIWGEILDHSTREKSKEIIVIQAYFD